MTERFRVAISRDFLKSDGSLAFKDIGFDRLNSDKNVEWDFLEEDRRQLGSDQLQDRDALLLLGARVTAASLEGAERLKIVARFGVGYDNVDVEECTRQGVILTNTPEAVRRPVASGAVALILALSHKLVIKDHMTRDGRWAEKSDHMGMGLSGRTLGIIGLGNIGREILRLLRPFELRHLATDPHVNPAEVADLGVELVDLESLLGASDIVCIACVLTSQTRHLLNADRLALMKPTAYLVNVARGPIVDQKALTEALRTRRIQGAAIDVYEKEPVAPDDPLLALENVIVTPHAISWTNECFQDIGRSASQAILDVAAGRIPENVVNREVLDTPRLSHKLRTRLQQGKKS